VALAVIAPVVVFFWPDSSGSLAASGTDPLLADKLEDIRATQQQAADAIKLANESLATLRADVKTLSDEFPPLMARVDTLQKTQTQMVRDSASLAEQLTAVTQAFHDDGAVTERNKTQMDDLDIAKASEIVQPSKPLPSAGANAKPKMRFPTAPSKPNQAQTSKLTSQQPSRPQPSKPGSARFHLMHSGN
jgi:hypothetical protein